MGSANTWEEIGTAVRVSDSGQPTYADLRSMSPPFLAAPASIMTEVSANIRPENTGMRGVTRTFSGDSFGR